MKPIPMWHFENINKEKKSIIPKDSQGFFIMEMKHALVLNDNM